MLRKLKPTTKRALEIGRETALKYTDFQGVDVVRFSIWHYTARLQAHRFLLEEIDHSSHGVIPSVPGIFQPLI
jgi:hypothetical protein